MANPKTMAELVAAVSTHAAAIQDTLSTNDIASPTFESGGLAELLTVQPQLEGKRAQMLEALDELRAVLVGPPAHVFTLSAAAVSTSMESNEARP